MQEILGGYTSSYKIWRPFKEKGLHMAYINLNKRIRKLQKMELIEVKKPGGYKHRAINYRLTSSGLVYLFSDLHTPANINEVVRKYPQNTLFKLFIYDFFEHKTLEHCTKGLAILLQSYMMECCQKIRLFVDSHLIDRFNERGESMIPKSLKYVLFHQLEWCKRLFILKVATFKEDLIDWHDFGLDRRRHDRDETFNLLANDSRFMNALKEYGGEFLKGYEKLIELKSEPRNR